MIFLLVSMELKVLGTFILEWDEGSIIANELLSTKESTHLYAERLAELASKLGFDGWLLNMEVKLDVKQIPNMKEFISHLTQTMHSLVQGSLVIWYDSVTVDGDLSWQDQLNEKNKPFFDLCDGIFVNYTWKENYPKLSAAVAGDRRYDVYMGIDVFGRNTYGGGKWNTNVALDLLRKDDVSAAIFAPGWVYETKQPPDFETAQNRWWSLVEKSWGILQKYPKALPFYTNFDQGRGLHISIEGGQVSNASWNNISSQGFQPFLKFNDDPNSDTIQVLVDFKEASYSGGGNLTFKGTLENNAQFTARLFEGELLLGDSPVHFSYSVKSKENSLLGLIVEFSSATEEKKRVFVTAKRTDQFSGKFSHNIVPYQIQKASGWLILEGGIVKNGDIITGISAVCYRPDPVDLAHGPAEYFAMLGHLTVKTAGQSSHFPPSSSWRVEGEYIEWTSGSQGSKNLSMKISWGLLERIFLQYPKYNVYVEKLREETFQNRHGRREGAHKYLGVAHVQAFYVSNLTVPSGIASLKFIIQPCDNDGSIQKLDDSPFFQLDV
ncbi:cytosolic endo-beta-N-acetylglucosaminidase 1 [Pistacia vera]|uniref:cytosolic endo-beta-N-acetylglucosaminidase 1 n=1 Tax=Pistacia vera TaxID=55513 RepID=UPI0012638DF8|nr:cytosolic endo-beta-N-acetylglucosaminidase 1 [Pistacia vera]